MKETAYLLQAALISAWWVGLAASSRFFDAFQFAGIPAAAFWAFFAPDMALIAGLSVVRAYVKLPPIEYIVLGAFGYASMYCLNATCLTGSGYLPTLLMMLGLAYNGFLCFNASLFRNASDRFVFNLAKTLLQVICVWSLALIVVPCIVLEAFDGIHRPEFNLVTVLGVAVFFFNSLLGLYSSYIMVRDGAGTPLPLDQTNRLVMTGPYRYVRNPMAIAGIGQGIAIAIVFRSVPLLIYSLLGAVVWHVAVRPIEERNMLERFGDAYADYQKSVWCWLPKFGRR